MKKSSFIVFISLLLVISACSAENPTKKVSQTIENTDLIEKSTEETIISAQVQEVSQDSNDLDVYTKLDNVMTHFEKYYNFSGAVYVGMGGEEIYSNTFGKADIDQNIANTLDTKFIIGSLTKQFTAAAILLLKERGLLELEHQITDYLPDLSKWEGVTIHHLLSMSSGIVSTDHPYFAESLEKKFGSNIPYSITEEEAIAIYKDIPLNFNPGEKFEYSNSNYLILGLIIERTTEESYDKFLEKNIFEPLTMLNTGYSVNWEVLENKAQGYEEINTENDFYPIQYDYYITHSSSGLYTTMNDLVTWDRALYSAKLLKKETIAKMYAPYTNIPSNFEYGSEYDYGYGWFTQEKKVEHAGDLPGFIANFYRELNTELVIIILSNNESLDRDKMRSLTNTLTNIVNGE
ncbi:serine hydrolase domain-containing protein [Bacillus sp. SCS-151]|uniref:serine hydrolase domain-containing protein n=1 Tax=Nanhaiella sioensis TaxID=3115293 RepID=UPI00397E18F0